MCGALQFSSARTICAHQPRRRACKMRLCQYGLAQHQQVRIAARQISLMQHIAENVSLAPLRLNWQMCRHRSDRHGRQRN
jgi:hypothetical protein